MTNRLKIAIVMGIIGLGLFAAALLIPEIPLGFTVLGKLIFTLSILGTLISYQCHKLKSFKIFILLWFFGAYVSIMGFAYLLFVPAWIMMITITGYAMLLTVFVHMPLLALTCYLSSKNKLAVGILCITSFVIALILPHFVNFSFSREYPLEAEKIRVTSDNIADKTPEFIDEEQMWKEESIEGRFSEKCRIRINKSASVVGIAMGELEENEKKPCGQLFSTYQEAISYAKRLNVTMIPSVQMIDHKAKAFDDSFYAAIEKYLQKKAIEGGKETFFNDLLAELINKYDGSEYKTDALAYIACGIELGGGTVQKLSETAEAKKNKLKNDFLSNPLKSKPVGFYTESELLELIFKQDRFFQEYISPKAAIEIAKVLNEKPELKKKYQSILDIGYKMTNPPSCFSVLDVTEYNDFFNDPTKMLQKMAESYKWEVLKKRGAGRESIVPRIQFIPHSTSKENELFAKKYNYSAELPSHNIMNELIKAIRSGSLDLTPDQQSGWYDYQIYALETLLVPEKGQEEDKLLLSKEYKERLIEAFKTMMTKKRELHIKKVELIPTAGISLGPRYLRISPDLSLEPTATYYLRTARGCRFILNSLEAVLGQETLDEVLITDDKTLPDEAKYTINLFYGLYFQVCEDIGMKPKLLDEELLEVDVAQAKQLASQWLMTYQNDNFVKQDVRYIVSALSNLQRTKVRYWMTVGVKLLKIKAEYVKKPRVLILGNDSKINTTPQELPLDKEEGSLPGYPGQYKYVPEEYFIPVEIFGEATGNPKPFTRDEFRQLCDKYKNKDDIIQAIESTNLLVDSRTLIFIIITVSGLALVGLFYILKTKKNRPS